VTQQPANDLADVYDAAATWHERRAAGGWSATDEAALIAWLDADPEHARAYADMAEVVDIVDATGGNGDLAFEMAQARRAFGRGRARRTRRSIGLLAAGVAGAALLLGAGGWFWSRDGVTEATYAAAPGRRNAIVLADGSRVALDGGAEIRTRLRRADRRIELTRGRAFFDVAHDPNRPFEVTGGGHVVRALGTAFEVDLAGAGTPYRVALLQGRVRVREAEAGALATELSPGQALVADKAGAERVLATDVAAATAWRAGRLVLRDETLEAAAAELNRRGGRQILVQGAARSLRLSGAYSGDDPQTFARAIAAVHGLSVSQAPDGAIVLSPTRGSGASAD
jgi:transmembrane sensor